MNGILSFSLCSPNTMCVSIHSFIQQEKKEIKNDLRKKIFKDFFCCPSKDDDNDNDHIIIEEDIHWWMEFLLKSKKKKKWHFTQEKKNW